MFKKLISQLKSLNSREPFDSTKFSDPIAQQTEWTPLKGGGSNFKTHSLKKRHAQRMEFRCSIGMLLFSGVFMAFGLAAIIGAVALAVFKSENTDPAAYCILPIFGLIFGSVGYFIMRSSTVPRIFDLAQGYYCRDRKKPEHSFDVSKIKDHVHLDQIHALQLISEYCRGSKSSYTSYELNLILEDGSRINVIDHGGRSAIQRDAEQLAAFLGKPLWSSF